MRYQYSFVITINEPKDMTPAAFEWPYNISLYEAAKKAGVTNFTILGPFVTQQDSAPRVEPVDLERQIKDLEIWIRENAPYIKEDQCHLDQGSTEQMYWNYGRLIALRDIYNITRKEKS